MNEKVNLKEKLAYGVGDAGCNFVWSTISMFLILYYTDSVGLNPAVVGTIMLVTRLLDGVTDLGMGTIIDKTNSKWGKARPWVLWSSVPLGVGLMLLFNVPDFLGYRGKIIYAAVTYIFLAAFAYTASNLSYNTLLSLITDDQKERTSISSIRFIFTVACMILLSFITMPIVGKIGWGATSIIYGIIAICLLIITFKGTKERYVPIKSKDEMKGGEAFKILAKNKYFWFVTLIFIFNYAVMGITGGVGIYYTRDVMNNAGIFGLLNLANFLPILIGLFFFTTIANKFGKWKCMMFGYVIQLIGLFIMLISPANASLVIIGAVFKGIGMIPHTAGLFAYVADVVDYGEWKYSVRVDGLTYSATSFGMKVGTGIGTAMVGWLLAAGNYNSKIEVQASSALFAMKSLYIYLPIVFIIISMIVFSFANIDKIYPSIVSGLEERRKTGK